MRTPGGDMLRPGSDHGNLDPVLVVVGAFGDQAVVPQVVAVVGGEDDERVVGQAQLVEVVEGLADGVVHA